MDDLLIIMIVPKQDAVMELLMEEDMRRITITGNADSIYHKDLNIKKEEDERGALCPGTLIYETNLGLLNIRYMNKNEEGLEANGTQTCPRFQHAQSFAPWTQKKGLMIGTFKRVLRLTSDKRDVLAQSKLLTQELMSIGYKRKDIIEIIRRQAAQEHNKKLWQAICKELKNDI